MLGKKSNYFVQSILLVVILYDVVVVNIEGGRRISFGKRISKPGSKNSKGGGDAKVKDTTSEPEVDGDEGMEHSMKCKGVNMEMNEKQVLHMKECANAVGVKSKKEMTVEKVPCFAKCIFEHKKLVDEKGMPHKENIVNMFTGMMTDEVKEELKKSLEKCIDEHASLAEPTDETCNSYTPLAMCVHMAYNDICQPNE